MSMPRRKSTPEHPRPIGRAIAERRMRLLGDPTEFMGTNAYVRPATGDDRVAIISDIHANYPALVAVLKAVGDAGISRIWCLGDTCGYGAQPVECLRLVRDRCELVLAGNHDLAVVGDESLARFGHHARPGVEHARRELERADDGASLREWLALRLTEVTDARRSIGFDLTFERHLAHHEMDAMRGCRIVAAHAAPSPWDSVWDYVGTDVSPSTLGAELDAPLILVGHTHRQFVHADGRTHTTPGVAVAIPQATDPWERPSGAPVVANPGSVGQPRDGNPEAAWLEFNDRDSTVTMHRVAYDIEAAIEGIREAGLPALNAARLVSGD